MNAIKEKIGPEEPITKGILEKYCVYSPSTTTVPHHTNAENTAAFEAISVYNAVRESHSYRSLERVMKTNSYVLCSKMNAFKKKITCSQRKARSIVKNVLGPYCLQMVLIGYFRIYTLFHLVSLSSPCPCPRTVI